MVTHSTKKNLGFSVSLLFVSLFCVSSQSFGMDTNSDSPSASTGTSASAALSKEISGTASTHEALQYSSSKQKINLVANELGNAKNRVVGPTAAWLVLSRVNKADNVESLRNAANIVGSRVIGNTLERLTEGSNPNNSTLQGEAVGAAIFGVEEAVCATTVRKQAQVADWLISRALQLVRLRTDDVHYVENLVTNGDPNNVDRARVIGTAEAILLNMFIAKATKDK